MYIIWFKHPFCNNLKTNEGKTFLQLLQHHFPKHHPMRKTFNYKKVKISHCFVKSMGSVILSLNEQVLNLSNKYFECNCREIKMNVPCTIYVLHQILCMRQMFPINQKMNAKDILVLLKHHLKKDSAKKDSTTILEASNIKSMRTALNFQNIFGV